MTDEPQPMAGLAERLERTMEAQRAAGMEYEPPPPPSPAEQRQALRAAWEQAIPPRFARARIDTLSPVHPAQATKAITAWCEDGAGNLILCGPTGTGKTWAAAAAARCRFGNGQAVEWWSVVHLLQALRPGGTDGLLQRIAAVDVLVLDDLAAHRATDWTEEQLYAVVDHRWSHQLPVIVTTNLPPEQAPAHMDERMFSRLFYDDALVVRLDGADLRAAGR